MLSRVDHACRTSVEASGLPLVGGSESKPFLVRAFTATVEMLRWAKANGCPWTARTCAYAARGGHLEVLKWAREQECPWDAWTCACAGGGGHLEVLKWAREQECPWDAWTCSDAAERGQLEVLKWLREQECPWDAWTCALAARGGQLEVLILPVICSCAGRQHPSTPCTAGSLRARRHTLVHELS